MKDIIIRERKLKNGKKVYEYRFEICSIDGKRKYVSKSGFPTKTAAKKAGSEALDLYFNKGIRIKNYKLSYSDFLDTWIDKDCRNNLKETTVTGYQKKIKNHIKPALGSHNIHNISREDLQDFINKLFDNGYSPNTLSSIIGIISKSFNYAVDNGYVAASPAVRLQIPKNRAPVVPTRKKDRENIPDEIFTDIIQRFPETHPYHIPLMLGYECGLRIGEVFGLVWEDIDFENGTLTVNRQIQWHPDPERTKEDKKNANGTRDCGNGYWYFANPKYDSFRTIDMPEHLTGLLKREYDRQQAMKKAYSDYYCSYTSKYRIHLLGKLNPPNNICNPVTPNGTGYRLNLICVRNDGSYIQLRTMQNGSKEIKKIYKKFVFHALRHTHASQLYAAGASEKYISERLGHKKSAVTKDVYIHLTDKARRDGKNILERLYPE